MKTRPHGTGIYSTGGVRSTPQSCNTTGHDTTRLLSNKDALLTSLDLVLERRNGYGDTLKSGNWLCTLGLTLARRHEDNVNLTTTHR